MIVLGFTGTSRTVLPCQQRAALEHYIKSHLKPLHIDYAIHGGADEGDDVFHNLCVGLGITVHVWPSEKQKGKKWPGISVIVHPITPGTPLNRNRIIVAHATLMIACPKEHAEVLRSGTWATVRYTRAAHKPITMIYPNGEIRHNANET